MINPPLVTDLDKLTFCLKISKQIDTDLATNDSKEFPSGIYFVKLEIETISENHKRVVKH